MKNNLKYCKEQIEKMLQRSKTKVIFPIISFGLLKKYSDDKQEYFSDNEIKLLYESSVNYFKNYLGHSLHIGGKYYDAYPSRNLPKYGVLRVVDNKKYILTEPYKESCSELIVIIPQLIKDYIKHKIGLIPNLENLNERLNFATDKSKFLELLSHQIIINPTNFEIFSFAILKTHLEKFACKLYRDTRTSSNDKGVDLSTNFGVVYQIKKLKLLNQTSADSVFKQIKTNFSEDRIKDGNVVLIIDDISKDVKSFLINMKIQSLSKDEILNLATLLDLEERLKVLRVVFDEFSREYKSDI
ncbi:MAG: HaeII family restriction endonuclease [Gammaproteobacteria bacterium]|nr:HaeII family restriction endonuclease [Gammaproteobacteria bacterium]